MIAASHSAGEKPARVACRSYSGVVRAALRPCCLCVWLCCVWLCLCLCALPRLRWLRSLAASPVHARCSSSVAVHPAPHPERRRARIGIRRDPDASGGPTHTHRGSLTTTTSRIVTTVWADASHRGAMHSGVNTRSGSSRNDEADSTATEMTTQKRPRASDLQPQ